MRFNDAIMQVSENDCGISFPSSPEDRLAEALVDMRVTDGRASSVVEDEAFLRLVSIPDPASAIPGRKALKATVDWFYEKTRTKTGC